VRTKEESGDASRVIDSSSREIVKEEDDTLDAKLPDYLLFRMASDPKVASALGSARLRRVLLSIDKSQDRVLALESFKRTEGAPFRDFLDDILVGLGVAKRVSCGEGSWGVEFLGLPPTTAAAISLPTKIDE